MAHFVHFLKSLLLHSLQSTYFPSFLLASKVHFAIASLADLSNDVELLNPQLRSTPSQNYTLSPAVRFPLLLMLGMGKSPLGSVFVELDTPLFASSDVSEMLEVVVKEVFMIVYSLKHKYVYCSDTDSTYKAARR